MGYGGTGRLNRKLVAAAGNSSASRQAGAAAFFWGKKNARACVQRWNRYIGNGAFWLISSTPTRERQDPTSHPRRGSPDRHRHKTHVMCASPAGVFPCAPSTPRAPSRPSNLSLTHASEKSHTLPTHKASQVTGVSKRGKTPTGRSLRGVCATTPCQTQAGEGFFSPTTCQQVSLSLHPPPPP